MNTQQINKALSSEPNFVGCFARDRLPKKTKRPAGLVINTDKASESGSHWVAYFISDDGRSEYFDPLGEPIPSNEILKFVKHNAGNAWMNTVYNNASFQSNYSTKCGQFCIFYLRNRLRGRSICEVHALLSRNKAVNDSIV